MWWQYLLVFTGAFLFDVVPFPFLPAFTIMVFLQIVYGLNIWLVIIIGVSGSILGRYILTLYIPLLSGRIFKRSKNEDIRFLGRKMTEKVWEGQMVIIAYSLLPLPTTPLFVAAGMAKVRAWYIIPAFFIGKFTSDSVTVHLGKYAAAHAENIMEDLLSWQSIISLIVGLLLLGALLFIDWRSLIQNKKLQLTFNIWKHTKAVDRT
jgi:membrane protein DedA with SNARE-associated domain